MEKIIVTEEQAKVIEKEFKQLREGNEHNVAYGIAMDTQGLSLVNIARIVEGEPYEVKREFKVGDIVKNSRSDVAEVVSDSYKETPFTRGVSYVNNLNNGFKLVCKVEDRRDLVKE